MSSERAAFRYATPVPEAPAEPSVCSVGPMTQAEPPRETGWNGLHPKLSPDEWAPSRGVRAPERALVLGSNGAWSAALSCADAGAVERYLMELQRMEQAALMAHGVRARSQEEAKQALRDLRALTSIDPSLQRACEKMQQRIEKKMADLPEEAPITYENASREHLEELRLEEGTFEPGEAAAALEVPVVYTLALCRSPTEKEPKKERQWRHDLAVLKARPGTVPVGCVTDTHVKVLYCDGPDPLNLLLAHWLLPDQDGRVKRDPIHDRRIRLPSLERQPRGPLDLHMAADGQRTLVALGAWACLLGEEDRVWWLTGQRTISCVSLKGAAAVGTRQGDVALLEEDRFSCVPLIEPVWDVISSPGTLVCMTVMGVLVERDGQRLEVEAVRPSAIAVRGNVLAIQCKYGYVQTRLLSVTGASRRWDPLKGAQQTLRPRVDAMRFLDDDTLVSAQQDGRIRVWHLE